MSRPAFMPAVLITLDNLNAAAGSGRRQGPRWATVGKGYSGKGGSKRKGTMTRAAAKCGIGSYKGVK